MSVHWVIFSCFAWGHLRPESNLAVNIVRKFPDVTVSIIVDADFAVKSLAEIKRNVSFGGDESLLKRIRLIALCHALAKFTPEVIASWNTCDPRTTPHSSPEDVERIRATFDAMMEERPFQDDAGKTWEAIGKPSLMISDLMMGHFVPALKNKYGLPLFMWYVGSAGSLTRVFGPTEAGGRAPTYVEECHAIEADPERSYGRSFSEIAHHVWAKSEALGEVIQIEGLPPIYQWEDTPQKSWNPSFYDSVAAGYELFQLTDGVLLPTVESIEEDSIQGVKEWYIAGTDRKVLCLGPQLPPAFFQPNRTSTNGVHCPTSKEVQFEYRATIHPRSHVEADVDPCIRFLDNALEKHGVHSVLYVSFGSIFFPRQRRLEILLERLLAMESAMPFIITTSSPEAFVSEELEGKIASTGRGLIVSWAPQQAVLAHPALSAILSHCGGGGTFESLSQGVPVIAWPFIWDQPAHALWMSEVLDTGYELLQIRDGPVKGKAMRGGPNGTEIIGTDEAIAQEIDSVLQSLQGEDGRRKRANAERVKQLIWEAHKPGGQIDRHLDLLRSV